MERHAANVTRKKLDALSTRVVLLFATCLTLLMPVSSTEMLWDHVVNLDENYQLLWKVREPDIVFEVQVKTRGYVGFGFSRDGTIYGADIFIGWIDNGHTFFHVSFFNFISALLRFIHFNNQRRMSRCMRDRADDWMTLREHAKERQQH